VLWRVLKTAFAAFFPQQWIVVDRLSPTAFFRYSPFPRFHPFAFFPMQASEKNLIGDKSKDGMGLSCLSACLSGGPLVACFGRSLLVYGQLVHSLPTKPSSRMEMAVAVSRGRFENIEIYSLSNYVVA
jgi:hypothetical protein